MRKGAAAGTSARAQRDAPRAAFVHAMAGTRVYRDSVTVATTSRGGARGIPPADTSPTNGEFPDQRIGGALADRLPTGCAGSSPTGASPPAETLVTQIAEDALGNAVKTTRQRGQ